MPEETPEPGVDDDELADLDVAVAHWHVDSWGGAEYLVTKLAAALGERTVFTVGEPEPSSANPYGEVGFRDVTASRDSFGTVGLRKRLGRVAEYGLWEDVDWREFGNPDVLVTSGSTTRAVITPDTTLHINYCHSPPRWFYDLYHDRKSSLVGRLARPLVRYLRTRDSALDDRVDHYFANSPVIARRLWKYYKRDSEVLYPPVQLADYENLGDEGFYLHLGRLDVEKGVGAIVEAFAGRDEEIKFAGSDGDADVLDRIRAAKNMEFLGFVSEQRKFELLGSCRAVVFNGHNEDFGIVPIEANASGKPCLVRADGFPGMFVEDGTNGYLHEGTPGSICEAIARLETDGLSANPTTFVEEFSLERFEHRLRTSIARLNEDFRGEYTVESQTEPVDPDQ